MKKITIFFSFLLIFTFFFINSSYAAENNSLSLPLGDVTESNYLYIHRTNASGLQQLYVISSNFSLSDIKAYKTSNNLQLIFSYKNGIPADIRFYYYYLENDVWILHTVEDSAISVLDLGVVHETNFDIYMSEDSDEIFFQKTPIPTTPTVELMVAEEVPKMAERIIRVMKIILLCGVGCLALLISLPLFGRVFRIFQVK